MTRRGPHATASEEKKKMEDVPLVEFMYLVFTHTPGESYRRRHRSLLLCLCDVFRALINSLVCWFWRKRRAEAGYRTSVVTLTSLTHYRWTETMPLSFSVFSLFPQSLPFPFSIIFAKHNEMWLHVYTWSRTVLYNWTWRWHCVWSASSSFMVLCVHRTDLLDLTDVLFIGHILDKVQN